MHDVVFSHFEAALSARGYVRTADARGAAFGHRYADYAHPAGSLRLLWDGRDACYVVQDGVPSRDLVVHRPAPDEPGDVTVARLLAAVPGA